MSDAHDSTRVCIVGGGPIGLEVAAALAVADVDYKLLEAKEIGHTMTWWAPQTKWFSSNERIAIAGVPLITADGEKCTRERYLAYLRTVIGTHGLRVSPFEPVVDVARDGDGTFTVVSQTRAGQRKTTCEAVVLAVGGTDFPRPLGCEGDDLPHVDGYLRDPHGYFGRDVLVVGGRNSAVEAALRCHHAGARVALSYRGGELPEKSIKYWLFPEINGLIKSGRIAAHFNTTISRVTATHVELRDDTTGDTTPVKADEVLALIGYEQDKRLFRRAGVELVGPGERPRFDEETMETNVPGLYVAGTAVAGTQSSNYKIFLENCHVHAERIVRHLGVSPSASPRPFRYCASESFASQVAEQPES